MQDAYEERGDGPVAAVPVTTAGPSNAARDHRSVSPTKPQTRVILRLYQAPPVKVGFTTHGCRHPAPGGLRRSQR